MKKYYVEKDACIMCGACIIHCKTGALTILDKKAVIIPEKCVGCGICQGKCFAKAIKEASSPA